MPRPGLLTAARYGSWKGGERALRFLGADALQGALAAYAQGRGDFADHAVRGVARSTGCRAVATSRKTILEEPGFVRP